MVEKIDKSELARQDRAREAAKEDQKKQPKKTDFSEELKKTQLPYNPLPTQQPQSKVLTEQAIHEAMKQEERQDQGKKKDDDEKDRGRDSRDKSDRSETRITGDKVVAKGRLKQGGGQSQGQFQGGGGMGSNRKGFSKVLKLGTVKSVPVDLKGKFAGKLEQAMQQKGVNQAALTQQVLNKIIQTVRVGINMKGEKEIQLLLSEKIFRGLKLRVISRDGKVSVAFRTSDAKGREVLEKNSDGLKKALADKGIDVDEIVVS